MSGRFAAGRRRLALLAVATATVALPASAHAMLVSDLSATQAAAAMREYKAVGPAPGPMCDGDDGAFRVWWTEHQSKLALPDIDGSCRTVPAAVTTVVAQLAKARAAGIKLGFGSNVQDDPPQPGLLRWPPGGDRKYDVLVSGGSSPDGGEEGVDACYEVGKGGPHPQTLRANAMEIFTGLPYGASTTSMLRTTATHEYFHGLQCTSLQLEGVRVSGGSGHFVSPPRAAMEASAEWFANAVYPQGQQGYTTGDGTPVPARSVSLCEQPTDLLAPEEMYDDAALLMGAFGPGRTGAAAIRSGLGRAVRVGSHASELHALQAFGDASLGKGLMNMVQTSCGQRTTLGLELPLLHGEPELAKATSTFEVVPQVAHASFVQVPPLSTAIVGEHVGATLSTPTTPGRAAALAAYNQDYETTFDSSGAASLPVGGDSQAVVVIGNPSTTTTLTANVNVTAN